MKVLNFFKGHWQLFAITAAIFLLWDYPVMYPLKVFVVFLHEASHALTTLLTGGEVLELSLVPRQGGHVLSRGGNLFLIVSSGYLGSLLLGASFLIFALRTNADRILVALLGLSMFALTAFYIRDSFPVMFCLGGGVILLFTARFLSRQINDLLLRIIGLTSMIYVPYDIFSDTLARSELRSDARILSEHFGGTTMIWGSLWLVISLIFILFIIKLSLKESSNIVFGLKNLTSKKGKSR